MATPSIEREGARLSVAGTTAAFTCRTNSNGVNLSVDIARDPYFRHTVGAVTTGSLNAANNYQATCYVSGLVVGHKYYWRIKANDGAGNEVLGSGDLQSGSFMTTADKVVPMRIGLGGCYFGGHIGETVIKARWASDLSTNILKLNLDRMFWVGDLYYPDNGVVRGATDSEPATTAQAWTDDATSAYKKNAWYVQSPNTDDGTLPRFRTNFITTIDGNLHLGATKGLAHVMAAVPGHYMWNDHDRGFNDVSRLVDRSGVGEVNKITRAHQVGHECYMDLNRDLVNQESGRDFATDALGNNKDGEEYYYVDIAPVRYIVMDQQNFRSALSDTDDPNKTMLGEKQLQWVKDRVDDNPQPFLALVSPYMGDGDHGYFRTPDCHKLYSYAWNAMLDHVWRNGDPHRTVVLSFDTHNGSIAKYRGPRKNRIPIFEFMGSNGAWMSSGHQYITGWSSEQRRPSETVAAIGYGGELEFMNVRNSNMLIVDSGPGYMRVSLVATFPSELAQDGYHNNSILYSREYR